jgi:hypothetical protein
MAGQTRRKETVRALLPGLLFAMGSVATLAAQISVSNQAMAVTRVSAGQLPTVQRDVLRAIGARLQVPGNERQTIIAQFARTSGSTPLSSTVTITTQLPGLLRMNDPSQGQTTIFNGTQIWKTGGTVGKTDEDVLESLVSDVVEGFFLWQAAGAHALLQGRSYKIVDSRKTNPASGVCDLLALTGGIPVRPDQGSPRKVFCMDSTTHLPNVVSYTRAGTFIETRFSNWQSSQGQMLPRTITRLENGLVTLTWTVSSITLSPSANDGMFSQP